MVCVSYIFISDLHLDEQRPDITQAFVHFINNKAASAERFFILGDLFEVWLGDDHASDFNKLIKDTLAGLTMPCYIMHGNRDFLISVDFCRETGFELLPDPTNTILFDKPCLLMHGDSLCTGDQQYMEVRRLLRNPDTQRDLLSQSLEERAAFANRARSKSRQHTRETAMDIMDVTPDEVTRVMQEHDVKLLIHGHTHRPCIHDVNSEEYKGTRIVLGDWDKKGWYLELDQTSYSLNSFDIGTPL